MINYANSEIDLSIAISISIPIHGLASKSIPIGFEMDLSEFFIQHVEPWTDTYVLSSDQKYMRTIEVYHYVFATDADDRH